MISLFIEEEKTDYQLLKAFWKSSIITTNFTKRWKRAIHDGYLEGTQNTNRISTKKITSKSP